MSYNKCIFIGRLTADPVLKQTNSGVSVCTFDIAVNRNRKDETDFFAVTVWRGTAEFVCKYFTKGKEILVEGEMQTRSYEDRDGNKRKAYELVANEVRFVGTKGNDAGRSDDFQEVDVEFGDLPF